MSDINLVAMEIDPNKKYLITPLEKLNQQTVMYISDLLTKAGFKGLILGIPMDITPIDQISEVDLNGT